MVELAGPTAQMLGTGPDDFAASLPPPNFEVGVIAGTRDALVTNEWLPLPNDSMVSLESAKWAELFWQQGHVSFWYAGRLDRADEVSLCVPEAYFRHPENDWINDRIWGRTHREPEVSGRDGLDAIRLAVAVQDNRHGTVVRSRCTPSSAWKKAHVITSTIACGSGMPIQRSRGNA